MRTLHPSDLDIVPNACPECELEDGRHQPWCPVGQGWDAEAHSSAGCGPWLLLLVGYLFALTAGGIAIILITLELAA